MALGPDQQRADEQRVPSQFGEDARLDAVLGVGAAIEVLGEQLLAIGMGDEILEQHVELGGRDLAVLLPPHRLLGALVADDELVLPAAAGMHAGLGGERAALHDLRLAIGDGMLVKRGLGQVPVDRLETREAELVGAMGAVAQTRFFHRTSSEYGAAAGKLRAGRCLASRRENDYSRSRRRATITAMDAAAKCFCQQAFCSAHKG